jgi:hypothetical protein
MATPLVALENSYLTPRSFGYLNFTLAFYPLILYSASPRLEYLLVCYFFSTLIFLSHRFATQSFVFAVLFFSILDRTWLYFGILVLSLTTATLITNGYYLRVLKGHIYNIYFWVLNYKLRFAHQIRGLEQSSAHTDFISTVYYMLAKFTPIALFGTNCWLLSPFLWLIFRQYHLPLPNIMNVLFYKFSLWAIFFYLLAVIVLSFKKLIPIGEGQRYLEMATVPASILTAIITVSFLATPQKNIALVLFTATILGNILLILIVQKKAVLSDINRSVTKDMMNIFTYINRLKSTPRIMCIPHQITTMLVYNTKADILVNADNPGLMKISSFYPMLTKPMREIVKQYHCTHLIIRESYAKKEELQLPKYKIVYRSGDISILQFQ